MAKFMGFTPDQQFKLLSGMGYDGPLDETQMTNFLAATPAAATKMGHFAGLAQKKLDSMKKPVATRNMAEGGLVTAPQVVDKHNPRNYQPWTGTVNQPQYGASLAHAATVSPGEHVAGASVDNIVEQPNQIVDPNAGQAGTDASKATVSTVDDTAQATAAPRTDTALMDPVLAADKIAEAASDVEAATGEASDKATVRGQLSLLMDDFETDGTPPWASAAMRNATAIMQQRGLGASSLAGQAILTATMEAALPIAMQDAKTHAQFELQNLNNEQQTTLFKAQQTIAGLFSDQAAMNTAEQINAASENQTRQFFADLETTVSRFNAEMVNGMRQFNAGEENATSQFNAQVQNLRDEFNAKNSLIVAQANAQWRQDIATANSTQQNEANRQYAASFNAVSQQALDFIWQRERDLMAFAFTGSQNALDRDLSLLLGDKKIDAANKAADQAGMGYLAGKVVDWLLV